jgi:hypothetical protein
MQTQDHQTESGSSQPISSAQSVSPLSPTPLVTSNASGIRVQELPVQEPNKEQEHRLKFSEETHQYVREQIRLADQKATFFFAGATALLAYLHKAGMVNEWVVDPRSWGLIDMFTFLATMGLILSAVACLATVIPRLNGSKRGLIFFAAIREYENAQEYVAEVMRHSSEALCAAKLRHIYELTDVCKKKYDVLKWGQWFGALGVIATLLLLLLQ